jgi:hypothetical protein
MARPGFPQASGCGASGSHRRPITGFPGYKRGGDWVLMTKPCA